MAKKTLRDDLIIKNLNLKKLVKKGEIDKDQVKKVKEIQKRCWELNHLIVDSCGTNMEALYALTHLEQCMAWAERGVLDLGFILDDK